ncbi:unnamed protein product, partial [Brassica oleracea]
ILRIKRSVSADYSQVCSLITYNQVFCDGFHCFQLTSNFFFGQYLESICYLFVLFPLLGISPELHF